MKNYSEQYIIDKLDESVSNDIDCLFRARFMNYTRKTTDSKKYCTEVIAEKLLNQITALESISTITRQKSYKVFSHEEVILTRTERIEENVAKALMVFELDDLGKVIDYQIPLKNKRLDNAGKIDIFSMNNENIYLIEVKYLGNKDTLLKTVLEIWTYYKQLNKEKFLKDYNIKDCILKHIKAAVLLGQGCEAYQEAQDLEKRSNLAKLIKALGVRVFLFEYNIKAVKL